MTLNPDSLDRHITGNYGADQLIEGDEAEQAPERFCEICSEPLCEICGECTSTEHNADCPAAAERSAQVQALEQARAELSPLAQVEQLLDPFVRLAATYNPRYEFIAAVIRYRRDNDQQVCLLQGDVLRAPEALELLEQVRSELRKCAAGVRLTLKSPMYRGSRTSLKAIAEALERIAGAA